MIEARIRKNTYQVKPHRLTGRPRLSFHSLPREVREQIAYQLKDNAFSEIEEARRRESWNSGPDDDPYFDSEDEDSIWQSDHTTGEVLGKHWELFAIVFGHIDYARSAYYECHCNFPVSFIAKSGCIC